MKLKNIYIFVQQERFLTRLKLFILYIIFSKLKIRVHTFITILYFYIFYYKQNLNLNKKQQNWDNFENNRNYATN